jgi:chromosome segregation ATPase
MSDDDVDPIVLIGEINQDARDLDRLSKRIHEESRRLDAAEHNWELVYDEVAEQLKEEMAEEGRKGDPAEHWIVTTTRRRYRPVWQEYREADRSVKKLERQLKAKTAALSGRQSELNALRSEMRVGA